jgi:uncharacterized protein CbrC (UPF0167 family)
VPPGAFGKTGSATTGRAPFDQAMIGEIEAPCELQAERATDVIPELVERIDGYRTWPQGKIFELPFPGKDLGPKIT